VLIFVYKKDSIKEIRYINRKNGKVEIEKVPGEFWLKWLYYNPVGKLALESFVKNKFISEFYGRKMDLNKSADKISDFVKEFNIDLTEAEKNKFDTFNDFFTRKLKDGVRPISEGEDVLVSPADGKVFYIENLDENSNFFVKGSKFNLKKFIANDKWYDEFIGSSILICRLAPADYHRFHFPLSGYVINEIAVEGDYYSVSPYAVKDNIDIYFKNKRVNSYIESKNFGNIIMSEVGAAMVGGIIETYNRKLPVEKGQEKGYFKFGGSTVVLIFKKENIKIDDDIIGNSQKGLETKVKMGEKIGVSLKKTDN
jgi:phosphatidylserine decarboxylase